MILRKLIETFASTKTLPIEVAEVRDALIGLGVQDEIVFRPNAGMDPTILRGLFYQFTRRNTPYGDPIFCSVIVYSGSMPIEWQRLVACKELVHLLDSPAEQTNTLDELDGLLSRLLGPLSSEDYSLVDIMAAKDRLALYQAIPLLFPAAARADAVSRIKQGALSPADIARRACLPLEVVALALLDEWPDLIAELGRT